MCQASLSITNPQSLLELRSIEFVMPSNHLILCHPLLLLPPNPPSIKVFSNASALRMRCPKYWSFSFNTSPSREYPGLIYLLQDGLVGSPCSPRDSQESSPTAQFESIKSLGLSLLYGPTLTSVHGYRKNHSFDYTNLCQNGPGHGHTLYLILITTKGNILFILQVSSGKAIQVTQVGGGKAQFGVQFRVY